MKCPVCSNTLTEIQAGDILVDVCQGGCGGAWFDERELKKFDEPHEIDGNKIIRTERGAVNIDYNAVRYCPRCKDEAMCKRWFDVNNQVEVDQCLKCSGIWLDVGELDTIRGQYDTEAERHQAADLYLGGVLKQIKEDMHDDEARAQADRWEDEFYSDTLRSFFRRLF